MIFFAFSVMNTCRSAMETTNSHIEDLKTINNQILELAKFVICQFCYHIIDNLS